MKKFLFFLAAVLAVAMACGGNVYSTKKEVSEVAVSGKEHKILHLNKNEFLEKVYNYEKNPDVWTFEGSRPVIVDFYASWCGPCKMIAPILEELASEYAGQLDIYKVNTDKERDLSADFGIQSIPTLWFVPVKGEPRVVRGAMPKSEFKKMIDEFLLEK